MKYIIRLAVHSNSKNPKPPTFKEIREAIERQLSDRPIYRKDKSEDHFEKVRVQKIDPDVMRRT